MKNRYLLLLFIALASSIFYAQVPSYIPTNGLVGWWPFNGNANDESGNGNNGTVTGATLTTDRFGVANGAYGFNGVNCCGTPDPVQEIVVSNQILNLGQNFTISCWMSSSTVGKFQQLLFFAGAAVELNNEHVPSKLTYAVGPGTSWDLLYAQGTTSNFQNNIWYHVIFTKVGTLYSLYLNGSLEGSTSVSASSSYTQTIGLRIGSLAGGHEVFKGSLDDFGIWNRALSPTEISGLQNATASTTPPPAPTLAVSPPSTTICAGSSTTLSATANATYSWSPGGATTSSITVSPTSTTTYTCTATANGVSSTATSVVTVTPAPTITTTNTSVCAGQSTTLTANTTSSGSGSNCPTLSGSLATGLVGYWPFCGNANDASGNSNNGTVNGATLTTDRFGNSNSAYSFDGVSNISLNNLSLSNVIKYSYTGWFKKASTTINQGANIISMSNPCNGPGGLRVGIGGNNQFCFGAEFQSCSSVWQYSQNQNYSDNTWHFFAAVYDGNIGQIQSSELILYIDGVLIPQTPFTQGNTGNVIAPINNLGIIALIGGLDGIIRDIDDIGFWNRVLTTAEIQALYTTGQTTYSWSNGATTPSITVSPTATTTYTCTVTDPSGTSCVATQTITVNPIPNVNAGADISVCSGSTATLTATGATTYSWTNSVQNAVAFTPIATTI